MKDFQLTNAPKQQICKSRFNTGIKQNVYSTETLEQQKSNSWTPEGLTIGSKSITKNKTYLKEFRLIVSRKWYTLFLGATLAADLYFISEILVHSSKVHWR